MNQDEEQYFSLDAIVNGNGGTDVVLVVQVPGKEDEIGVHQSKTNLRDVNPYMVGNKIYIDGRDPDNGKPVTETVW